MARSSVYAEQRKAKFTKMLSQGQSVSITSESKAFNVHEMTIRRDLKALEESGLAVSCLGGVLPNPKITLEFKFECHRRLHLEAKRRIGLVAAGMIEPGQIVVLDTGSTTLEIARCLLKNLVPCTIITNSLLIASELWNCQFIELMLLGGRVRSGSPDLVGPGVELLLEQFTSDIAFLGSDGIDAERGSFAGDIETALVVKIMAVNSRRSIVVADGSKLNRAGVARCLKISELKELITDKEAPSGVLKKIRRRGVKVTLA